MYLTNEKIKVTHEMMERANMTKVNNQYGVPIDPTDPKMGLKWKRLTDLTDDDYDRIEQYFLKKHAK